MPLLAKPILVFCPYRDGHRYTQDDERQAGSTVVMQRNSTSPYTERIPPACRMKAVRRVPRHWTSGKRCQNFAGRMQRRHGSCLPVSLEVMAKLESGKEQSKMQMD